MARGSPLAQGRALSPAFGRRVGGVRRGRPSPCKCPPGSPSGGPRESLDGARTGVPPGEEREGPLWRLRGQRLGRATASSWQKSSGAGPP